MRLIIVLAFILAGSVAALGGASAWTSSTQRAAGPAT